MNDEKQEKQITESDKAQDFGDDNFLSELDQLCEPQLNTEKEQKIKEIEGDSVSDDDSNSFSSREEFCNSEDHSRCSKFKLPRDDNSDFTFSLHTSAIMTCSVHPTENLVVTGGHDQKAYVWDILTGEVVHVINARDSGITIVAYCPLGIYLAVVERNSFIQVYTHGKTYEQVWTLDTLQERCHWMKWHNTPDILVGGDEGGTIYFWKVKTTQVKTLVGEGVGCTAGAFNYDGSKVFAGYTDGKVILWDLRKWGKIYEIGKRHSKQHDSRIISVACDPAKDKFLSGGSNGKVILTTSRGSPMILYPIAGSVESLAFCPEPGYNLAASATMNGILIIFNSINWDIKATLDFTVIDSAILVAKWIPQQTIVCATSYGSIYGFDGTTGKKRFHFTGHNTEILDINYDQKNNILLSASLDATCKLYKNVLKSSSE